MKARNGKPESYNDVVAEIQQAGGKAFGISTDTADEASVTSAFETIKKELPNAKLKRARCFVSLQGWSQQCREILSIFRRSILENAYLLSVAGMAIRVNMPPSVVEAFARHISLQTLAWHLDQRFPQTF